MFLELTAAPGMCAMAFTHVPWQIPINPHHGPFDGGDRDGWTCIFCGTIWPFMRGAIAAGREICCLYPRIQFAKETFNTKWGAGFRFRIVMTSEEWDVVRGLPEFAGTVVGSAISTLLLAQWLDLDAVVTDDGAPERPLTALEVAAGQALNSILDFAAVSKGVDRHQRWTWDCGDAAVRANLARVAELVGVTITAGGGGVNCRLPPPRPIRERIEAVNRKLREELGVRSVLVDPRCATEIDDLQSVQYSSLHNSSCWGRVCLNPAHAAGGRQAVDVTEGVVCPAAITPYSVGTATHPHPLWALERGSWDVVRGIFADREQPVSLDHHRAALVEAESPIIQRHPDGGCNCTFTVDPNDEDENTPETAWHYLRVCPSCGAEWWALHCPHELSQRPCERCGVVPEVVSE